MCYSGREMVTKPMGDLWQIDFRPTATREHQSGNEVVSEDTANQLLLIKNGERESVFTFLNTKTCISLADMRFFVYLCSKIMLNNKF